MPDFALLLVQEIPALRRYARALARDPVRADDLVQDCLERAVSRQALWRQEGSLRSWLFAILHNQFANQARRETRRPDKASLDAVVEFGKPASQPVQIEMAQVARAMEALAEQHRDVLFLVAVEGLTYLETAAVLDVPIGTVMSRLARARERLRVLMQEGAGGLRRIK